MTFFSYSMAQAGSLSEWHSSKSSEHDWMSTQFKSNQPGFLFQGLPGIGVCCTKMFIFPKSDRPLSCPGVLQSKGQFFLLHTKSRWCRWSQLSATRAAFNSIRIRYNTGNTGNTKQHRQYKSTEKQKYAKSGWGTAFNQPDLNSRSSLF